MTKMFSKGFVPKSNTKKAKSIIRSEMRNYYRGDCEETRKRNWLYNMQQDANACSAGRFLGSYGKGKELVNAGCFACYYDDQRQMLSKIYGKRNVDKWSGDKVHSTYSHLIGREYSSLLSKKEGKK